MFPEMLQVTEGRQYRERELLHISDQAYIFFMEREKRRVELLNLHILKRAREEMVEMALVELKADQEMKMSWLQCFDSAEELGRQDYCQRVYSLRAMGTLEISVRPCLYFSSGNRNNDNSPKSH